MKFLNGTKHKKLRLSMDNIKCIKWYVDARFAVRANEKQTQKVNKRDQFNNETGAQYDGQILLARKVYASNRIRW